MNVSVYFEQNVLLSLKINSVTSSTAREITTLLVLQPIGLLERNECFGFGSGDMNAFCKGKNACFGLLGRGLHKFLT